MKILLCYATAGEGKIIKEKIKGKKPPACRQAGLNLKINLDITYLCTGMGMYETIFNLTKVLNSQTFDIVLNIGVCGYVNESKKVIQVARTVNLSTDKELIVPIFLELASMESIGCSEKIIKLACRQSGVKGEIINYKLATINYIDMESWAIEYVCDKFRVPRVILKVPVDKIGEEEFDKEKAAKMLKENLDYKEIIKRLAYLQVA